jgi:hypothetical protein
MEMKINFRELIKDEVDKTLNGLDQKLDKHTKGYMFDSLVYRFKDYQSRAFNYEVAQIKHQRNLSQLEAEEKIKDSHNRDLMRFIQILDEAIGEHD